MEKPDSKALEIADTSHLPQGEDLPLNAPAEVAAPTSGVQEPPEPSLLDARNPGPIKIDETDFLRYQLLGSQIQHAQTLVDMYQRELQRAQIEMAERSNAAGLHLKALEEKYSVDLRLNQVSADGYLIPRPIDPNSRMMGMAGRPAPR